MVQARVPRGVSVVPKESLKSWQLWLKKVNDFMGGVSVNLPLSALNVDKWTEPKVDILLNDFNCSGIFDSGAQVSLISSRIGNCLNIMNKNVNGKIWARLANGEKCELLGKFNLEVSFPCDGTSKTVSLPFWVCQGLLYDCILGIDFLRASHVSVSISSSGDLIFSSPKVSCMEVSPISFEDKFKTLFEESKNRMDSIKDLFPSYRHAIDTGTASPLKIRPFPLSPARLATVIKLVTEMETAGVVSKVESPWSLPYFVMQKDSTKEPRFILDARKLNAITKPISYFSLSIKDILSRLHNSKVFSLLDLKRAYWRIGLTPEAKRKVAFVVPSLGHYCFNVLPFGLRNAAQVFQTVMDSVLGPTVSPFCHYYMDDIVIATPDVHSHYDILKKVLDILANNNLIVNFEKSHFLLKKIDYLGFEVDENGIRPSPKRIKPILEYPTPRNLKELRRFLGMLQFYRQYLKDLSSISEPLRVLTHKNVPWEWSPSCDVAFKNLIHLLTDAPILTHPDFSIPFQIHSDASRSGLGGMLVQNVDGVDKVIAYSSRSLSDLEKKFSTIELECLGVLFNIEHFRQFVDGTKFTVYCDAASLKWINNFKDPHGRIARWLLRIQQFDFEVIHKKGKDNVVPDALSRCCIVNLPLTLSDFENRQPCDKFCQTVVGSLLKKDGKYGDKFKLFQNVLFKLSRSNRWVPVVPVDLRERVLSFNHDQVFHPGIFKTYRRIMTNFYWPGCYKEVCSWIKRCKFCGCFKPRHSKPVGLLHSHVTSRPNQILALDFSGPYPISSLGNRYVLLGVDIFTGWVEAKAFPRMNGKIVVDFIANFIMRFGAPDSILTDNGRQFKGNLLKDFLFKKGIKHSFCIPYHPQSNPAERYIKSLKQMLRNNASVKQNAWDCCIDRNVFVLNSSVNESTGATPASLQLGREIHEENFLLPSTFPPRSVIPISDNWKNAKSRRVQVSKRNKLVYDKNRLAMHFNPGDFVWVRSHLVSSGKSGFSSKLGPQFSGPFVVSSLGEHNLVNVKDLDSGQTKVVHCQDLKKAFI